MNVGILAPTVIRKGLFKLVDDSMFDIIWAGDMPQFNNPYINLTKLATETKRIKLGLGCTNPYTRSPFITASAICRINELASGRLALALGAGSLDVLTSINMGWIRPVQRCKETIEIIRALSRGETLTYEGQHFKFRNVKLLDVKLNWHIPIYVACRRPNMLMMAGATADGVLMDDVPVEYVGYAKERIKEGAVKAGKSLERFRFSNLVPFSVSEDRQKARELVKKFIAINLITVPERALDLANIDREEVERIKGPYPNLEESAKFVTDHIIDKFSIAGTLDECIEHVSSFVKKGINELSLAIPRNANVKEMIGVVNEEIIPRFKKST